MAAENAALATNKWMELRSPLAGKLVLLAGVAGVLAIMVVFWLWSQKPDYRVLFSSYSDKDGGAIIAALEQMGVPYQVASGGGAILVPEPQVHDVRLKLAAQGLPKGGNVGFELLENQKFGVSHFIEQVNFQRGLEGELERSIQSIGAVQAARVHLAIPKPTVFVREQQKPTASVLLNLHPGRVLDQPQVNAVVHLVASSVPNLPAANVTVVDQNGTLLSDAARQAKAGSLDPGQLKYVEELQQSIVRRVESILAPVVGASNVRAQASAEVDFSTQEQAAETYRPNQDPAVTAVRSQQTSESQSVAGTTTGGVPGALSNQPPPDATAPLEAPAGGGTAPPPAPLNSQKSTTTNFEVDKTVRYTQQPMGGVKRLTVAVVVNHKRVVDSQGKVSSRPLTEAEKNQIGELAKQAMGFDAARGDSLSVVNSAFVSDLPEVLPEPPLWQQPEVVNMGLDAVRYLLAALVLWLLYRRLLKPLLQRLLPAPAEPPRLAVADGDTLERMDVVEAAGSPDAVVELSRTPPAPSLEDHTPADNSYQGRLESVRQLARENPKLVAGIVSNWVNGNE